MSRTTKTMMRVALIAVLVIGVVGCASTRLKKENEALKAQQTSLTQRVAELQAENDRLSGERAGMQGELDRTRAESAARQRDLEAMTAKLSSQGFDVQMREGMMVVTLPTKILYPSGSANLSSSGQDKLRQLAKVLNSDLKGFPIEVQGHTDTDPISRTKDKYLSNWELSFDRAQTVVYYLIKSGGIDPKRIHSAAYGEFHPVAGNASSDGKAKNRRVEIVVMQPASGM